MTVTAPAAERVTAARRDARRRANTELRFLVVALATVLVAYSLVGLAQSGVLPAGLVAYGGALGALALVAHLAVRRLAPGADPTLLPTAFLLNGLGLVMVRRIDFASPDQPALAPPQTLWTVVAVAAFCATLVVITDPQVVDRYRYLIGASAIVLLLLPLLPLIGREVNGARIWLRLGPMSFQPGELAKLALVAFFASYLAEKRPLLTVATKRLGPLRLPEARAFAPIAGVWAISLVVLIFERDLGLSLLVFGVFVAMLYVATARMAYVIAGVGLFAAGGFLAWRIFAHVQQRVATWLDPFADPDGAGFQLSQSLFAFGSGGIGGVGLGQGRPDLIPAVSTDFIYAAFGEELGLLGTTALLLCFLLLIGRGFGIALRARDDVSTLLAAGLTTTFGLQVFVILGGVTRLIPLTGITLPFISYGGSSLVANYILVALLLRVSSASRPRIGADVHSRREATS